VQRRYSAALRQDPRRTALQCSLFSLGETFPYVKVKEYLCIDVSNLSSTTALTDGDLRNNGKRMANLRLACPELAKCLGDTSAVYSPSY
jgi:hypothetical protein